VILGLLQGRSDYEIEALARLDYVELGFKPNPPRSNYVEIGWNLWGLLPHLLPQPKDRDHRVPAIAGRGTVGETDHATSSSTPSTA
jgi:hypothetical protein